MKIDQLAEQQRGPAASNSDDGGEIDSAIAIVGIAIRLSGGITSPDEFWKFLIEGKDGLGDVPSTRYNIDSFYGPGKQQCVKTRRGYFLQQDPALFDADFFDINSIEAEKMDPQQRQLLEVTSECLESAGETGLRGTNVGCYVGVFGEDWLGLASQDPQATDRYHVSSTGQFALANRLSYQHDWRGPSMTIQTACSSSMVGLHEGCQALLRKECNAAVVAGVNLILNPAMTMGMSDIKILAADGACKTFDDTADGYGRGEGISVVLIKRLEDAVRDNDAIRAVIRATNTNFDGKTPTVFEPGIDGQETLIRQTYKRAGIRDIGQTAFFECHGTGTPVGDVVETSAIARALQDAESGPGDVTVIGSVKPNVGHTEGASGLTSVIKAVLCLENDAIPPNVFFTTPNPRIPFTQAKLLVPRDLMPFPAGRKKRVSVNCFGVGGSNAHAILDSAASVMGRPNASSHTPSIANHEGTSSKRYLLVLSAKSLNALEKRVASLVDYTQTSEGHSLDDLSYTLCCRREHFAHRAFAVVNPSRPVTVMDFRTASVRAPSPVAQVWLFGGQGVQWVGMAKQLLTTSIPFQNDMEHLDMVLKALPDAPDWSIREELTKSVAEGSRINETEMSQPLSTAIAVGLVNQLHRWGLKPEAVIGHSSGELAAAYASGAISAASAIVLAYYRGLVSKSQDGKGAMAAVGLSWQDVKPYLEGITDVVVACRNSPRSTVLSGAPNGLDQVINAIKEKQPHVFCRKLRVSVAYHSSQMEDPATAYEKLISGCMQYNTGMVPMYSTASLTKITEPMELSASYWSRGLASPVQFADAVADVILGHSDSQVIFLEIGSHSTFSGLMTQIFEGLDLDGDIPVYIPTLTRNDPDANVQLLSAVGRLHCLGIAPDMPSVTGVRSVVNNLPYYPWKRQRHWYESRLTRDWRLRAAPHHELLGSRVTAMSDLEPAWRNILRLGDVIWMSDHVLDKNVIFPVAGYVAMAGAACMQLHYNSVSYLVRNLVLRSFLTILPGKQTEILTTFRKEKYNDLMESDWFSFSIFSHDGIGWTKHCDGQVRAEWHNSATDEIEARPTPPPYARKVNPSQWYKSTRKHGYEYGRSFRGLANISADPVQIAAIGTIDETAYNNEGAGYVIHPTNIDRCLQMMGVALGRGLPRRIGVMEVPKSIGSVFVARNGPKATVQVRGVDDGNPSLSWNATAVSDGRVVLSIKNMRSTIMNITRKATLSIPPLASLRWEPLVDLLPPRESLLSAHNVSGGEVSHTWTRFLRLLAHLKPALRVLEIGANSPDITKSNLENLKTSQGTRLFSSYTLTGVSTVALDELKLQFNDHPAITLKVFDVHRDIRSQGMEPHSFDLVLTSDASPLFLPESLGAFKQLLTPTGWLLFQNAAFPNGFKGNEFNECKPEVLNEALRAAEFNFLEVQLGNESDGKSGSARLTALAKAATEPQGLVKEITLLTGVKHIAWEDMIADELVKQGYNVARSTLSSPPVPGECIISMLDLQGPILHSLSEQNFQLLREYLLGSQSKHILWLTKGTQLQCCDPRYGLVHGLLRTLRHECRLDMSILELDVVNAATAKLSVDLQVWISQTATSLGEKRDSEFVIVDGTVHVGRYHWVHALPPQESRSPPSETPFKLQLKSNSLLQDCTWDPTREAVLGKNEVQVDLRYVGLNFRDIMIAMGLIGNKTGFGLEGSGIVSKVGDEITDFKIGDRVGVIGSGLCQTHINVPATTCWKPPESLSLESAASTLVPFLTALYSLIHAGGLRQGQSVLIHSACGGVGLAALQVCKSIGAKIYATVGTNDKVDYLMKHFSLPRNQIFNSRDDSFLAALMRESAGRGADIVLNSLSGKLLHASWECVASFGKMIELGKVDFSTNGRLNMSPFAKNRAFIGVDLLHLASEAPEVFKKLIVQARDYFEAGQFSPLPLEGIYDALKATDALRKMQAGQHIGKFVLRIPIDTSQLHTSSDLPVIGFPADASYLLVGGLGGLGRSVSNWMAEHGARELIYLSRTARQTAEEDAFVRELAIQGCKTVCVVGSVTNLEDVRRAVSGCNHPLKGVLQLSAILRDRTFANMTYDEWTECLAPKVVGTWNLHEALKHHHSLDFFVVFGSLAGVHGNSGQSNYAAANTYLEGFVHYRRQLGLPCSLLNLGPVEDVGMLSEDELLLRGMRSASCRLLSEADVCQGLSIAISQSPPTGTGASRGTKLPLLSSSAIVNVGLSMTKGTSEPSRLASWTKEARFALYSNLESNLATKPKVIDEKFRAFVSQIEEDPSILNESETELIICREIARLMTGYLGNGEEIRDEDIGNIAIDSLMAMEIKDWVRGNMNLDISMDQTTRARTSGELASHTIERLKVQYGLAVE